MRPTAGDIFVWGCDTAALLYRIRAPATLGHLTAFAWNRGAGDDWMFATGTLEGAVQVWTVRPEPDEDADAYVDARSASQITLGGPGLAGAGSTGGGGSPRASLRWGDTASGAGFGLLTDSPTRERFASVASDRSRGSYFESVRSSVVGEEFDGDRTRPSSPLRQQTI